MDVLYVMLGGSAQGLADEMSPALTVTFDSKTDGRSGVVRWPMGDGQPTPPIQFLVTHAKNEAWRDISRRHLRRYPESKTARVLCDQGPHLCATITLDSNDFSDSSEDSRAIALIARSLRDLARQTIERKTIFVFPSKWEPGIEQLAVEMTTLMVSELCAYLREAPVDQELPWAFISIGTSPDGQDPLRDFIRRLHSELVADRARIDFAAWRRKGGPILLSGPTGSGKSYAAKLLAADKKYKTLVEVNLAAVADEQLESRMRGYKDGTFTGAAKGGRAGWFEEADGGVLFLDEFQSVALTAQVQLLDLLSAVSDEVQIARTGADHERRSLNVKVILAINEDVEILLRENRIRSDIYFRIRQIESFPSLKERLEQDAKHRYLRALLVSYRWKSLRTIELFRKLDGGWRDMIPTFFPVFHADALAELARQEWSGNFRELERTAFDLFYDCDYQQGPRDITKAHVMHVRQRWHASACLGSPDADEEISGMERRRLSEVESALRESGFVISTTLQRQIHFRSRQTLRKYLHANINRLSEDIRRDSRITKFLKSRFEADS